MSKFWKITLASMLAGVVIGFILDAVRPRWAEELPIIGDIFYEQTLYERSVP